MSAQIIKNAWGVGVVGVQHVSGDKMSNVSLEEPEVRKLDIRNIGSLNSSNAFLTDG